MNQPQLTFSQFCTITLLLIIVLYVESLFDYGIFAWLAFLAW